MLCFCLDLRASVCVCVRVHGTCARAHVYFSPSTNYTEAFFSVHQKWLERTPGITEKTFRFWEIYYNSVNRWLDDSLLQPAKVSARAAATHSPSSQHNASLTL